MGRYLDKFADTIGKTQSEQVLKLLNQQRNTGQIRSVQEFAEKLEVLVQELTATTIQPMLKVREAEADEDINSEVYNYMLDRVEDDLNTAFTEANNIDEVQRSHDAIIRDVILKNLRAGTAELESRISLFEFLNKDLRGFDSAIFSTFRESKAGRTLRESVQAKVLFTDPRQDSELIPASEDATIELVGERLVLAVDTNTYHTISDIRQIFDSDSPQSEKIVSPPGNTLRSIIDNTKGTYWIQSVLVSNKTSSIKTKLELNLGSVKEVNVIEIEPASRQGLVLESLYYVDGNNVVTDLSIVEQTITSPVSLRIRKVATSRLIVVFRNDNPIRTQFQYYDKYEPLFSQALNEPAIGYDPSIERAAIDLDESISSEKIKSAIGVSRPTRTSFSGWEFLIGIDNIRVGLSSHEPRSTYVSSSMSITGNSVIGLKTIESRPYIDSTGIVKYTGTTYDLDQQSTLEDDASLAVGSQSKTWFQGSIEYWAIKLDYTTAGTLSRITKVPILPLNVDRIYHERLFLTEKSSATLSANDLATFMFYTTRTDGDIKVYQNGILLTDATGDASATEGWQKVSIALDGTPNIGSAMKFQIKILDQLPGDIFTVSYKPVVSSTTAVPKTLSEFSQIGGLQVVDMVGDLTARLLDGQLIALDRISDAGDTAANVFLAIILRQNTADTTLTPAVEEYTLVSGRKDETKFEEI